MDTLWPSLINSLPVIAALSLGLATLAWVAQSRRFQLPLRVALLASTATLFLLIVAPLVIHFAPAQTVVVPHTFDPVVVKLDPTSNPEHSSTPVAYQTTDAAAVATRTRGTIPWKSIFLSVWLLGIALLAGHFAWQLFRLRGLRNRLLPLDSDQLDRVIKAWPKDCQLAPLGLHLRTCGSASSPYSFRRHLVIPTGWLEKTTRQDLLTLAIGHELAHLQHRDFWQMLGWRIAVAIHWWNPLVWLLRARAEHLLEFRADLVATHTPEAAIDFSRLLIETANTESIPSFAQAVANPNRATLLKERIQRLFDQNSTRTIPMTKLQRLFLSVLAVSTVAFVASCASMKSPLTKVDGDKLMKSNREIAHEATNLADKVDQQAARIKNAADSDEFFAVEVKFFEMPKVDTEESVPNTRVIDEEEYRKWMTTALKDRETTSVSYPRVITKNRRTVTIQSVVNLPFIDTEDKKALTTKVNYIPIGTQFAACPTRLKNGKIQLPTSILTTSVIGDEIVEGNRQPVVSGRYLNESFTFREGQYIFIDNLDSSEHSPDFPREILDKNRDSEGRKLVVILEVRSAPAPPPHPSNPDLGE